MSEIRATYARAWRARPDAFSKDLAAVAAAREARDTVQRSIEAALTEVDVLVLPTVPVVAPKIAGPIDGARLLQNTWAFSAARVPAVSVPCGTGAEGLPVGLQLVGGPSVRRCCWRWRPRSSGWAAEPLDRGVARLQSSRCRTRLCRHGAGLTAIS